MKKITATITIIAAALLTGCENVHTNISLINSRSPAINAAGTNDVEAATNMDGGGTLTAEAPLK